MHRKPAIGTHVAEMRADALRSAVAAADASSYFAALDADPAAFQTADLARDTKAILFADWFARGERDLPHLDVFLDVVRSGVAIELRALIAAEVLASLPAHLTWQAPRLIEASAPLDPPFGELLRPRVLGTKAPARRFCLGWLASRGGLQLPADLPALLSDRDSGVRAIGVDWLEIVEPVVLSPIAELLREVVGRERRQELRRKLARVARAVPLGPPRVGDPDRTADGVGQQIAVEWDAGGGRVKARLLMRGLAKVPGGAGVVVLSDLAAGAAAPSLRRECRAALAAVAAESTTLDEDLDRGAARRMGRGRGKRRDHERARRRLEDAMLRRRPIAARSLLALVDGASLLVELSGQTLARAAEGELEDLHGRPLSVEPDAPVRVPHPVELPPERVSVERARLDRLGADEAVPQVHREIRRVEPHERGETVIEIPPGRPRSARPMWGRGWSPDPRSTGDPGRWDAVAEQSVRVLGEPPVRAVWSHAPTPLRADPIVRRRPPDDAMIESVAFYRGGHPEALPLGEVDPIVWSEVVVQLTPPAQPELEQSAPAPSDEEVDALLELVERIGRVPELSVAAGEALTAIEGAERVLRTAAQGVRDAGELAMRTNRSTSEVTHIVERATVALEELLRSADLE